MNKKIIGGIILIGAIVGVYIYLTNENPAVLPDWVPTVIVSGVWQDTITFQNGDVTLAGTLDLPAGEGPFPALVTVHGSSPVNRNDRLLLLYSDFFVQHGFAVLRYDKRGAAIGESTGKYLSVGTNDNNLETLADDVVAGVEYVKSLDMIDSTRIGVMGLSQAGWIVPLAASKSDDIAFFVAFSGPVMSVGQEIYYSELTGDVMGEGSMSLSEALIATESFEGDHGYDPIPTLEVLETPGLWILGGRDNSVPTDLSIKNLDSFIAQGKDFTYIRYPNANHGLRDEDTGAYYPFLLDTLNWYKEKFE